MVKVKKELVKKNEVQNRERYPALSIERNEDDYVYGVIKDLWFYEDKRFGGRRLGITIDVKDGAGEVWDAELGQAIHEDNISGTHTLFFRHSYVLKAFEDKAPAEVIGQEVLIYNMGRGDRGYLYRVIIGDAVKNFVEE